jgi:hypothetical protein
MKQTDWMKVIVLTRGYLTDMWKQSKKHGRKKGYREKSAEAIVLRGDIPQEGPNFKEWAL